MVYNENPAFAAKQNCSVAGFTIKSTARFMFILSFILNVFDAPSDVQTTEKPLFPE